MEQSNKNSGNNKITVLQFGVWMLWAQIGLAAGAFALGKLALHMLVVPFAFILLVQNLPALALLSVVLDIGNPFFLCGAVFGTVVLSALLGYLASFVATRKKQLIVFFASDALIIILFAATIKFFPLFGALGRVFRDM